MVFLPNFIMNIKAHFQHFSHITDHVDQPYLDEPTLIYVVVKEFRKLTQAYLLLVIESNAALFIQ